MEARAIQANVLFLQLQRLQQQFIRGRKRTVIPSLWRRGLEVEIYNTHLYPTAVVDIKYEQLDVAIRTATRQLFQLPPDYPNSLLHWELRLWPSELLGHRRALRFAHHLCSPRAKAGPSWFHDRVIARTRRSAACRTQRTIWNTIQDQGPIGRITLLLSMYKLSWEQLFTSDHVTWKTAVTTAIDTAYRHRVLRDLGHHVISLRNHIRLALTAFPGSAAAPRSWIPRQQPAYLRQLGDLGRVAMIFKGPALRLRSLWPSRNIRPPCLWCLQPDSEHGYHMLTCRRPPDHLRAQLEQALQALQIEAYGASDRPRRPDRLRALFFALTWPKQTQATLIKTVTIMGAFINQYRRLSRPAGQPDQANPIWRVQLGGQHYI